MITRRHLCPRHCEHSVSVSTSVEAPQWSLASLNGGVLPRSLCLVRVPYIRTRTSPSQSRASRLTLSRPSLLTCHSSRLSSRACFVSGLCPSFSRFTSPLSLVSHPSRVSPPSEKCRQVPWQRDRQSLSSRDIERRRSRHSSYCREQRRGIHISSSLQGSVLYPTLIVSDSDHSVRSPGSAVMVAPALWRHRKRVRSPVRPSPYFWTEYSGCVL